MTIRIGEKDRFGWTTNLFPSFCGGNILHSFARHLQPKTNTDKIIEPKDRVFEMLLRTHANENSSSIFMADMVGGYGWEHVFRHVDSGKVVEYRGYQMAAHISDGFRNPNSGNEVMYCTAHIISGTPESDDDDDEDNDW